MIKQFLTLIRGPLFLTAAIDSVTGQLLFTNKTISFDLIITGMLSSLFYMLGIIQNDIIDMQKDSKLYPQRPLPSKTISISQAIRFSAFIAVIMATVMIVFASHVNIINAAIVLLLIFLYNHAKEIPVVSALVMGAVRMCNFLLGVPLSASAGMFPFAMIHFIYISACTNLSLMEKQPDKKLILINAAASFFLISLLINYTGVALLAGGAAIIIVTTVTAISLYHLTRYNEIRAVSVFILFLPLLDFFYIISS